LKKKKEEEHSLTEHSGISRVQRVLGEAHPLLVGKQAHGAIEVATACEIEQRTSVFGKGHNDDVEAPDDVRDANVLDNAKVRRPEQRSSKPPCP
jgi:hypothetical protein